MSPRETLPPLAGSSWLSPAKVHDASPGVRAWDCAHDVHVVPLAPPYLWCRRCGALVVPMHDAHARGADALGVGVQRATTPHVVALVPSRDGSVR